jgi:hypothetical protein
MPAWKPAFTSPSKEIDEAMILVSDSRVKKLQGIVIEYKHSKSTMRSLRLHCNQIVGRSGDDLSQHCRV